jgi:hypothetical protein
VIALGASGGSFEVTVDVPSDAYLVTITDTLDVNTTNTLGISQVDTLDITQVDDIVITLATRQMDSLDQIDPAGVGYVNHVLSGMVSGDALPSDIVRTGTITDTLTGTITDTLTGTVTTTLTGDVTGDLSGTATGSGTYLTPAIGVTMIIKT